MRILTVLTYYRPHTSGLTIYAERLAKALVARGHQVTVFTTQYEKTLALEESLDGVRIVRVPVLARISKGVFAPKFGLMATQEVLDHDVVLLHLPQFDAPGVALRGRLSGKPTVLTYHCDLKLPTGMFNKLVNQVVHVMNHLAAKLADRIVTYTQDYADHSPYLSRYTRKLRIIQPPVELPPASNGSIQAFSQRYQTSTHRPVIGMAARFAAEKGVEVLLDALPEIIEAYPQTKVLFAGQHEDVMGELEYSERLMPCIEAYQEKGQWEFVGILNIEEMAAFYQNLDTLIIPSLNSTEAFGLVQIEAMINGVPCVASALPGVRQPILTTGMGKVVPIGDSLELAEAILDIMATPDLYQTNREELSRRYSPDNVAIEYERLFEELIEEKR